MNAWQSHVTAMLHVKIMLAVTNVLVTQDLLEMESVVVALLDLNHKDLPV